jgi:hypothetical protein
LLNCVYRNIWNSTKPSPVDLSIIEALGKHYRFSSRLTSIIKSWDKIKLRVKLLDQQMKDQEKQSRRGKQALKLTVRPLDPDPEMGGAPSPRRPSMSSKPAMTKEEVNLLKQCKMTHDSLNYTSVDQVGGKCKRACKDRLS